MKCNVVNIKGEKVKEIDLDLEIFGEEMREHLLHSVVKAHLANQRQGTHKAKSRAFVSGTGKKPFKQKGTGNARQGCSRSPLMPGGAVLFGPQPRDYREKVNKKARSLALRVALSERARHAKITLVDDIALETFKTKAVKNMLGAWKLPENDSHLIISAGSDEKLYKSARNLYRTEVLPSNEVNAFHVMRYQNLIMTVASMQSLCERLKLNKGVEA